MQNISGQNFLETRDCFRRPLEVLSDTKVLKFIIVGDSSVGKTCLTHRFCERKFLSKTDATIGVDFHERSVKIGDENIKLQLWDTAGLERFRKAMVKHYYRNANAVVIVYDMTKISTFKSVDGWVAECEEQGLDCDIPRVLVGTHCDCTDRIAISTSSAQRLADRHGMPLFETSAKLDSESETLDAIFMTLAHKVHSQQTFRIASVENSPMRLQKNIKPTKTHYKYSSCNDRCC